MVVQSNTTSLYLDLLKKTLSYSLWEEPAISIEVFNYQRPLLIRTIISFTSRLLALGNLQISRYYGHDEARRAVGKMWPVYADTMVGLKRLDNIQFCVESVLQDNIPGDLIETGVWRGGSCILMRGILAAHAVKDRRVFVADSFQGLPPPHAEEYPEDSGDKLHTENFLAVSQEQVAQNFRKYGLLDDQVIFLKGWFKDTLPQAPIEKLAVMRLDGDMYESTMEALTNLYPRLSPGGYCIIDDYSLPACRKAVGDYRRDCGINNPIQEIDWTGVYWRK